MKFIPNLQYNTAVIEIFVNIHLANRETIIQKITI